MAKIDLRKELRQLYTASPKAVALVDVPEMNFLMIDGQGDPNQSQEFQDAIGALHGISYTIKFARKKAGEKDDFAVMPLEGLAVQVLHVGPHSDEPPTIARMHEFARQAGYRLNGKHHEIYMSDPRRVPPAKWKTILRQPVARS